MRQKTDHVTMYNESFGHYCGRSNTSVDIFVVTVYFVDDCNCTPLTLNNNEQNVTLLLRNKCSCNYMFNYSLGFLPCAVIKLKLTNILCICACMLTYCPTSCRAGAGHSRQPSLTTVGFWSEKKQTNRQTLRYVTAYKEISKQKHFFLN